MKKVYLGIFMAFGAMYVSAQHQIELGKYSNALISTKKISHNNTANEKATVVWEDDMSNASNWDAASESSNSSVTWVWRNDPSDMPDAAAGALNPFASATASNGFFIVDSDGNNNGDFNGSEIIATLTSPTIDLTGESYVRLQFQHNYRWWHDTRKVRISVDNGTTWTDVNEFSNVNEYVGNQNSNNPEVSSFDISAIAGGQSQVKVQFYYQDHDYWAWYWVVDDVKIIRNEDYDLSGGYNQYHSLYYQYSQVPLLQVTGIDFEAEVKNAGILPLTDIKLVVDVTGAVSTSVESSPLTLNAGELDTLVATFTPGAVGTYLFSQSVTLNETDEDNSNDPSLPNVSVDVTDFIYAGDKGAPYTAFPSFTGVTVRGTGVGYDIYQDQTLHGVDIVLNSGTASDGSATTMVEIREYDPNFTDPAQRWVYLTETDAFNVTSDSELGQVITLPLSSPITLEQGKTYLAYITTLSGTVVYSYSGLTDLAQPWLNLDPASSGTYTNTWYYTDVIPVVRLNFNPSLSVADAAALEGVKVYPNPSEGIINVSNDLNVENTIVVTDITGKVVASKVSAAAATIDLSTVGTGIYLVEVANQNGKKVERVVIK